jgi:hypothetical protein
LIVLVVLLELFVLYYKLLKATSISWLLLGVATVLVAIGYSVQILEFFSWCIEVFVHVVWHAHVGRSHRNTNSYS